MPSDSNMLSNVNPSAFVSGLSDIDQRIRKLNLQGLSNIKISKALLMDKIEVCGATVGRHIKEMLQDPENDLQVNFKQANRKPKSELKWYNIILKLKDEIDAYTRRQGFKPSSRTMFYHFQDLHIVKPQDINQFIYATVHARLEWVDTNGELEFPKLDPDCFSDSSRLTIDRYDDSEPEERTAPGEIPDWEEYIEDAIDELKRAPENYKGVGEPGTDGEIGGRWYDQPEYVEVWTEKNDLLPAFETILKGKDIRIRSGKGFGSLEFLYECTEQLKELMESKDLEPEHIHILYCGDMDPSGVVIDNYYKRRFRQLGIPGIDFERIAVTQEQIKKYNLPLESLEAKTADKKRNNTNLKEYRRLYGDKATHLNAFFTEAHLPAFKKILLKAVDKHWSQSIYNDMVDEYDRPAEEPDYLEPEALADARADMYEMITEAFKPGWENENN